MNLAPKRIVSQLDNQLGYLVHGASCWVEDSVSGIVLEIYVEIFYPLCTVGSYVEDGKSRSENSPPFSLSFLPSVVPITTVGRKQYIHPDEDY